MSINSEGNILPSSNYIDISDELISSDSLSAISEELISSTCSENLCRICLMPVDNHEIKSYCRCDGSTGIIHKQCLLKWIVEGKRDTCEICNYKFDLIKKYVYNWSLVILSILFFSGIIVFSIILVVEYNKDSTLLFILIATTIVVYFYYIKNSSELYLLKSLNIMEISETTRLI